MGLVVPVLATLSPHQRAAMCTELRHKHWWGFSALRRHR